MLLGCQQEFNDEAGNLSYISGANVEFRNELGPSSRIVGRLQSGERVYVILRRPRWAQVRVLSGETGWVLQRYLVSQDVYDRFAELAREAEVLPSQGRAQIRRDANLHLEPQRNSQAFYQLAEGEQADVVGHRATARNAASSVSAEDADADLASSPAEPDNRKFEDWLLVRGSRGRTGWLLESSANMHLPIEIAQYREGLRIRAWFEIYRELDVVDEKDVVHPWYLWATSRRAGAAHDFDEIRIFVWNPTAARYETSYRERNLTGYYPIVVQNRQTPEGDVPAFRLQIQDATGQRSQKSYFMAGRQVRIEK